MKYAIVYSSKTGNTKMLAERLREILPEQDCLYFGTPDEKALAAERLYIGFWCDKGTCDAEAEAFLKNVRGREVYLFGTAGFGGEKAYFDKIMERVQKNLNRDVKVIGTFMCQGKMPLSVRERYEKMLKAPIHAPNVEALIENFDVALSHPNEDDFRQFERSLSDVICGTSHAHYTS